jgi:hypothetical protein
MTDYRSAREGLSTRAAAADRDRIRAQTPIASAGAVSGAKHDADLRGLNEAAGGNGQDRSRIAAPSAGIGSRAAKPTGSAPAGRASPADGSNRPRLRMPGDKG